MPEAPSCCDGPLELARKILLQFLSMVPSAPASLYPIPSDSLTDLYRKILQTLNLL